MIAALATPLVSALGTLLGGGAVDTPQASPGPGGAAIPAPATADFGTMLTQMSGDAIAALKDADTTATSALQGKASARQAVESILAAERALQTSLAVRDKLVGALQEITRMAI
jgi:flagellar hook-basal body complex protein FliE